MTLPRSVSNAKSIPNATSTHQIEPPSFQVQAPHKMINPTYLAQRTRSCMYYPSVFFANLADVFTAANWADAKRRVLHSYRDWLRAVCCSWKVTEPPYTFSIFTKSKIHRRRKSSKCTPWISQSRRSEQKYARNLRDIDMWLSWTRWTYLYSIHIKSSRYEDLKEFKEDYISPELYNERRAVADYLAGNVKLLETIDPHP